MTHKTFLKKVGKHFWKQTDKQNYFKKLQSRAEHDQIYVQDKSWILVLQWICSYVFLKLSNFCKYYFTFLSILN